MSSIQIRDLSFEEDLSYDKASNIAGGAAVQDIIKDILLFAQETVNQALGTAESAVDGAFNVLTESVRACAASSDPAACLKALETEL